VIDEKFIQIGQYQIKRDFFELLYGEEKNLVERQILRYTNALFEYEKLFGAGDVHFFSTPGRTEIGGNHTDHNAGKVIAAAVNLDSIAIARKSNNDKISVYSDGFKTSFEVDLNNLEFYETEIGTTTALIKGIVAKFLKKGYKAGGFLAYISSDVLIGSGLSSSASIEILIGTMLNYFFNAGAISKEELAYIGQYAENKYFGKPCGLMDQLACATGGVITIDFRDPQHAIVEKIDFDIHDYGYSLVIVDTGGSHADLTLDYESIPKEMKSVAKYLGYEVSRDVKYNDLFENIKRLRLKLNDRAILRTLHFIDENLRVDQQVQALKNKDFYTFLNLVNESGNSSFRWLQNVYTTNNPYEQGLSLALAFTERFLKQSGEGACRVHGGGFAGTIQVFISNKHLEKYVKMIKSIFNNDSLLVLTIRQEGTTHIMSEKIK